MRKSAFTTLELIVVVSIIAIILGIAAVSSQVAYVRNDLNSQTSELVSDLRLQQSKASNGEGSGSFGIHLDTDEYVIFEGSAYSSSDQNNLSVEFSESVRIENISLNGGGQDIIFTAPHGRTTHYGSFDIVSDQISQSKSIQINSLGLLEY